MKNKSDSQKATMRRRGNIGAIGAGLSIDKKIKMLEHRPAVKGGNGHGKSGEQEGKRKRASICILGPNAAFLERSMFSSFSKENKEDNMNDEADEER